jgi:hypothetical protein
MTRIGYRHLFSLTLSREALHFQLWIEVRAYQDQNTVVIRMTA